ncbi:hypothetical protein PspR76_09590 [Pseudomonas sp. R76]|nr:hypothetical protein PspR76_09590 [Pseudomonas sp. R76]
MWELACVGAGLPAMQPPRCFSCTAVMPSQASQLPHMSAPHTSLLLHFITLPRTLTICQTPCAIKPR